MLDEVLTLLKMLTLFGYQEEASLLQSTFGEIVDMTRGSLDDIWPDISSHETCVVGLR